MVRPLHNVAKPRSNTARVTMRDIARLAGGFHPSTVSLALRNDPSISAAVRQRIRDVARKAGYRRDPLLDAFNSQRLTHLGRRVEPVIAFVLDFDSRQSFEESPRHVALWRGAVKTAETLRHRVELFFVGRNALTAERLDSILHARSIHCLVAAALSAGTPPLNVAWDRYSTVKIDSFDLDVHCDTIGGALLSGVRQAMQRTRDLGHRRIGLILNRSAETERNDMLLGGYLVEVGWSRTLPHIPPLVADETTGVSVVERWVQAHAIDAVLSDWAGFPAVVASVNRALGHRLAWASLNGIWAPPGVACLIEDHERAGELAVEQVVTLSRSNQRGIPHSVSLTLVPVRWRDGDSLRQKPRLPRRRHVAGGENASAVSSPAELRAR